MKKHTITPARRRSATVTRRRRTRTTTRRRPAPLSAQDRWLVHWHLRRGIVRPRLALLTLVLVWSLVAWLVLAHLLHTWPLAQAATPSVASAWPITAPVSSIAQRVPALYQGDPGLGWDSAEQYQTWWPSACGAAALTAVLRAWGTHVGIGPALDRLWTLHAISAEGGCNTLRRWQPSPSSMTTRPSWPGSGARSRWPRLLPRACRCWCCWSMPVSRRPTRPL